MPETFLAGDTRMKHPSRPDTQPDEYIADLPSAHRTPPTNPDPEAVNPVNTSSMPRGEDDVETFENSPEFNDRPGAPKPPDR
jgi:hypothetical protein